MGTGRDRTWQKLLLTAQLKSQRDVCAICGLPLYEQYAVLDRFDRIGGFTQSNVRALHVDCEALVLRRRAAGYVVNAAMEAAE